MCVTLRNVRRFIYPQIRRLSPRFLEFMNQSLTRFSVLHIGFSADRDDRTAFVMVKRLNIWQAHRW